MYLRATVFVLWASLAGYACGVDATANQDCNTFLALNQNCSLQITGLNVNNCAEALYFLPTTCQSALHTYLTCAGKLTCAALSDPNTCVREAQAMEIACENGNATVTTGTDGNSQTKPRSTPL